MIIYFIFLYLLEFEKFIYSLKKTIAKKLRHRLLFLID